jgi:hypothetical protein
MTLDGLRATIASPARAILPENPIAEWSDCAMQSLMEKVGA